MVPVLPALRQLLVEEGHKPGRGAPSGAGWTAQKASFHRHWLPQNPTAHLANGCEGPARMVITEPAFHGLAVEQQWISHHHQCSVCLQPFQSSLCFFYYYYWVNLARAEVLSWQNWAVKSPIDVRKEQVWWHNVLLVPYGQAALGPFEPLHNLGLQCQTKRGVGHLRSCWSQGNCGNPTQMAFGRCFWPS